jgi:hypothetical protein
MPPVPDVPMLRPRAATGRLPGRCTAGPMPRRMGLVHATRAPADTGVARHEEPAG